MRIPLLAAVLCLLAAAPAHAADGPLRVSTPSGPRVSTAAHVSFFLTSVWKQERGRAGSYTRRLPLADGLACNVNLTASGLATKNRVHRRSRSLRASANILFGRNRLFLLASGLADGGPWYRGSIPASPAGLLHKPAGVALRRTPAVAGAPGRPRTLISIAVTPHAVSTGRGASAVRPSGPQKAACRNIGVSRGVPALSTALRSARVAAGVPVSR